MNVICQVLYRPIILDDRSFSLISDMNKQWSKETICDSSNPTFFIFYKICYSILYDVGAADCFELASDVVVLVWVQDIQVDYGLHRLKDVMFKVLDTVTLSRKY
jgi:hypothetical protein